MTEAPKNVFVKMTEGYESNWWGVVTHPYDEDGVEYIRADLVEAAIKRALEGVVDVLEDEGWLGDSMLRIRALDPAQFIEEPKP
jgi:hypothetical protein